ncbi:UbiX family flavin prenyltransferase [Leucobacter sp. CSA1]|uniref:Flavin prenyltransferase UbiX n=1 Tax=Leucobacter chromiisoli TaxID=2796471 RepID=A0A934Q5Y2_9MICO|nr:UbiX family flavin prenyltransferase [Leucobacter chromiisoli]MBK0417477.1 UbiX family flavin prenyltransferase [Leucobacter chromiisoli]
MRRLIVAITGASGALLGVEALRRAAAEPDIETHAIVTGAGLQTLHEETDLGLADVRSLADHVHKNNDLAAPPASGSFRSDAMIVAPCSVTTLSSIANSYDANLVVRAADVMLKERRPLVLLFRETPFHLGHIRLMEQATMSGAIVMPPMPAFYLRPQTVDDIVVQTVGRAFDLAGMPLDDTQRWNGPPGRRTRDGERAWNGGEGDPGGD